MIGFTIKDLPSDPSVIRSDDGTGWKVCEDKKNIELVECKVQGKRTKSADKVRESSTLNLVQKEQFLKLLRYNAVELIGFKLSITDFNKIYMSDEFNAAPREWHINKGNECPLGIKESKTYIIPKKEKQEDKAPVTELLNDENNNSNKLKI